MWKESYRKFEQQTKFLHALLICVIQEEVALFHSTMHLETQAQTGILHQVRVDVMDQGLQCEPYSLQRRTVVLVLLKMNPLDLNIL